MPSLQDAKQWCMISKTICRYSRSAPLYQLEQCHNMRIVSKSSDCGAGISAVLMRFAHADFQTLQLPVSMEQRLIFSGMGLSK